MPGLAFKNSSNSAVGTVKTIQQYMVLLSVPFSGRKMWQSGTGDEWTHWSILPSSSDFRAFTGLLVSTCDSVVFLNGVGEDANGKLHCDTTHK